MPTLAEAYVQIIPSAKGIKEKIGKELGDSGNSTGSSWGKNFTGTVKKLIAAAGIGAAVKSALSEGAALEQSIGGVETLFKDSADIEIIEKHHNRKADAPSGTALMLADGINEACGGIYTYKYGRTPEDGKRDKREIGIHAVRGGNIVGVHDVLFITDNEIVTISHQAQSRSVFADGAIAAAKFVCGRGAGYYDMQSMLDEG